MAALAVGGWISANLVFQKLRTAHSFCLPAQGGDPPVWSASLGFGPIGLCGPLGLCGRFYQFSWRMAVDFRGRGCVATLLSFMGKFWPELGSWVALLA